MNIKAAQIFSRLILPEHTVRIKLLGDSITHGVGGDGFAQNGEPVTSGFARNPDGYCWANLFRDELESRYDCRVINNACTGTNIEFVLDRFDELVDRNDDIVLCTIGTNNRHQYFANGPKTPKKEYMERFYRNILQLDGKFREAGIDAVLCANIPASAANERDGPDYWRVFHMNDVHDLYLKASFACGFPFVSLYAALSDYCAAERVPLDSLLADGLHPNNEGHRVMFGLMMREIGLACPVV